MLALFTDRPCGEEMEGGRVERWGPGSGAWSHRPAANWLCAPPDFGRQAQWRRDDLERRSEDPGK